MRLAGLYLIAFASLLIASLAGADSAAGHTILLALIVQVAIGGAMLCRNPHPILRSKRIMALLDALTAAVAAVEATDSAAQGKIDTLTSENTTLKQQLADTQAQLAAAQGDATAAQALADRLTAANTALAAKVSA